MPGQLRQYYSELVSEDVQEVISYRPHWMIRKGGVMFLLILLVLLVLTNFVAYPDRMSGTAELVSLNAPKMVSARNDGKVMRLFVLDGEPVTKGQHLGFMESTASYDEVMQLRSWIENTVVTTQNHQYEVLVSNALPALFNLGELQTAYQNFQNQLVETKQLLTSGYYQNKKTALRKDVQYLATLRANTNAQKNLLEQDQQLQKKEYDAYESLEKDKVIAPLELNQYKSKLIAKEQSLKEVNSQITNTDIASHSKEKEIMDLEKQIIDQEQKFHSVLLDLKSEVEKWVQQYVLVAPEDGTVMFVSTLQENQLVSSGQSLFYVQSNQSSYYSEVMVGQKGFGKIKNGQRVVLRAEGYPSEEYGYLQGTVSYISNMPGRRDSFLIKVNLPHGLKTNYEKEIFFRNNLLASAEIITDNRTLFDRLLGQLKQVWQR